MDEHHNTSARPSLGTSIIYANVLRLHAFDPFFTSASNGRALPWFRMKTFDGTIACSNLSDDNVDYDMFMHVIHDAVETFPIEKNPGSSFEQSARFVQ